MKVALRQLTSSGLHKRTVDVDDDPDPRKIVDRVFEHPEIEEWANPNALHVEIEWEGISSVKIVATRIE